MSGSLASLSLAVAINCELVTNEERIERRSFAPSGIGLERWSALQHRTAHGESGQRTGL
jgi:hypothetical protein